MSGSSVSNDLIKATSMFENMDVAQLSGEETARRLPYGRLVPAIHRAASELRDGKIQAPPRLVTPMENSNGSVMCMPASASDLSIVKLLTVLPGNAGSGHPTVQGQVSVFDAANGRPLALLDAGTVTSRRTAAVSMAGAERLLTVPPRSVMVVGNGVQAASHIEAFANYFGIERFHVAARNMAGAAEMRATIRDKTAELDIALVPATELDGFPWDGLDVIVCATTSTSPVIPPDIPDNILVIGVGAYRPDMIELPQPLLRRRSVIVDTLEGARHEAGDLIHAELDWAEVAELCDIEKRGMPTERSFVLKTVGHAAWDLAACRTALE